MSVTTELVRELAVLDAGARCQRAPGHFRARASAEGRRERRVARGRVRADRLRGRPLRAQPGRGQAALRLGSPSSDLVLVAVSELAVHAGMGAPRVLHRTRWPFLARSIAGVDGSSPSLAAARVAASLGERLGVPVMFLVARGSAGEIDADRCAESGLELVSTDGIPTLLDAAADADLIVLGSWGLHGLRALGSVSERVAHRARSSILVVREPA